ncbi:Putative periplasmic protein [Gloeomargarita lithophora Alchichica-D10]|uniref:Periplasmic protein n=1 Tax=Gloeomargarita lithophora Alchichica-D10 TaxID=1188229 RepID=A0A1J0A8Y8_9CYAN|nr:DUF2092 domain-containing protein [Gloeomargarita lithophora]APB32369.1 Putative periplasmic protein [Gloeomargarita lithophora Alchichica-D10]
MGRNLLRVIGVGLVGIGVGLGLAVRLEAQTPIPSANQRQNPILLLQRAANFLKAKPSFSFETDIQFDNILESGQKVQYSAFQKVYVQRPNRLRVDYTGDLRATRFFFDGQTMTLQDADQLFYATRPMVGTIDDAIAAVDQVFGLNIPLSNLVVSDPYGAVAPTITNSRYLGMGMVNRVPAHHLLYQTGERDVQVWVSDGREPTVQKILITYRDLPGSPQYTAVFSRWQFAPPLQARWFRFRPPAGVGQVESSFPVK